MISLYSGTPGSGKSLHLAERLYYRLKNAPGMTIGNFTVNINNIKGRKKGNYIYMKSFDMHPHKLIEMSREAILKSGKQKEGQFLLILDEAQMLFNPREWNAPNRRAWLEFFTVHRHYCFDIILISQHDRMLDRQVRALIEYEWIHRKVTNFGWQGKLLFMINGFRPLFVCVKIWYPMKEKIGSEFFRLNKKYTNIYDTFATFTSADS